MRQPDMFLDNTDHAKQFSQVSVLCVDVGWGESAQVDQSSEAQAGLTGIVYIPQ